MERITHIGLATPEDELAARSGADAFALQGTEQHETMVRAFLSHRVAARESARLDALREAAGLACVHCDGPDTPAYPQDGHLWHFSALRVRCHAENIHTRIAELEAACD